MRVRGRETDEEEERKEGEGERQKCRALIRGIIKCDINPNEKFTIGVLFLMFLADVYFCCVFMPTGFPGQFRSAKWLPFIFIPLSLMTESTN